MGMNAISRIHEFQRVWLDDRWLNDRRQIVLLYNWYKFLGREGEKFGCLVNGSKSWLIVETQDLADEVEFVFREKSE